MVTLYVITGLVSALFLVVILTGVSALWLFRSSLTHIWIQAVRAFRHPERYGPRAYDPTTDGPEGEGQTRALGIARAVLDTFPVIKWGRNNNSPQSPRGYPEPKMGREYNNGNYSSRSLEGARSRESAESNPHDRHHRPLSADGAGIPGTVRYSGTRRSSQGSGIVDPAAIGRETCPICIVDFEEGDDVRVLPCPGQHRFHKDCVDPWLLELSTSCPICREGVCLKFGDRTLAHIVSDFQALENMAIAQDEDQAIILSDPEPTETNIYPPQQQSTTSWFAKYMSFAQRKRRSRGHRPPSETGSSHSN
jgi:hypothetical protein